MNRFTLLAAGTATVLAAGTATAIVSASASPHVSQGKTLKFHAKPLDQHHIGKSHEVETDVLTSGGKTLGYATESCFFGGTGDKCTATFTLKTGVLYGHYTFPISDSSASTTAKGKITGGLAGYDGDTGNIKIHATTAKEKVVLSFGQPL